MHTLMWPRRRPQGPPRGCETSTVQTASGSKEEPRCARYGSTPEGGCSRNLQLGGRLGTPLSVVVDGVVVAISVVVGGVVRGAPPIVGVALRVPIVRGAIAINCANVDQRQRLNPVIVVAFTPAVAVGVVGVVAWGPRRGPDVLSERTQVGTLAVLPDAPATAPQEG